MTPNLFRSTAPSLLALAAVIAAQYVLLIYAALRLFFGEEADVGCLGRIDERGYCTPAWGWWSLAVYSPEIAVLLGGAAALVARRRGWWYGSLAAAAVCLLVVLAALLVTQGEAVNQMPFLPGS